ncbi:uncharacterized protein (UPF0548 family) [Motilibacter peucedani]|uniref:Uncharacterized protein (UPF0548 family) n=1 Tax=Motilibacter peucedani TaxID=598650 RepID=A0A420XK49_9ACTN|nr:DUF1990 domain-containing protein [Motilibacter peucedani]RKS68000.1 uncharacterized protein (UPF0548 family) [Motilibacter peucedani]
MRSVRLRRPSRAQLAALLAQRADAPQSYAEVGISLEDVAPPRGWGQSVGRRSLGSGEQVWLAAREALLAWDAHRGARVRVEPPAAPLAVGTVVAVTAGAPLGAIVGVCRIVRVVDEPHRFGFAYGTVPPHPEVGEESFLVTRDPVSGEVVFTARSVSRAVALLARLAPPLARLAIAGYTRAYARAVSRSTASRSEGRSR